MKGKRINRTKSSSFILILLLFFSSGIKAQENFQVKWTMDYTLQGSSSHANFTPAPANLLGGPNAYGLPTIYSAGGAIVVGYIVRPWPTSFSTGRCMEFSFTANSFKYNISSISFRLRRSSTGPAQIRMRTSIDSFSSDLIATTLPNSDVFYSLSVPATFNNLTNNTFSVRIYGYGGTNTILGVLWFDEIVVNGQVLAIVLPVDLTYFKSEKGDNAVTLRWETAWEKNSTAFEVERSSDMQNFETIDTVPAAGETSGRTPYYFTDPAPLEGNNYYRLRLVDRDGRFSYSKTLHVYFRPHSSSLSANPNPASPEKIILSGLIANPENVLLTTSLGVKIPFKYELTPEKSMILYPRAPLPAGLYLLTIQNNPNKEHVKILVR